MPVMVWNYVAVFSNESPDAMGHNKRPLLFLSVLKMTPTFIVEIALNG